MEFSAFSWWVGGVPIISTFSILSLYCVGARGFGYSVRDLGRLGFYTFYDGLVCAIGFPV